MKTLEQIEEQFSQFKKEIKELKRSEERKYKPYVDKSQLEVGKWYIHKIDNWIIFITELDGAGYRFYGKKISRWVNKDFFFNISDFKPATDKEVEDALIKEAKRRGFKKGVRFNQENINKGYRDNVEVDSDSFRFRNNTLSTRDAFWIIFQDGKWAEIIEQVAPVPTINGHKMEVRENTIKFGCEEYFKCDIKSLYQYARDCRISHLELRYTDATRPIIVSLKQLEEVVDYLNK